MHGQPGSQLPTIRKTIIRISHARRTHLLLPAGMLFVPMTHIS